MICVFDGHSGDYGSCFISHKMREQFESLRGKQLEFESFKKVVSEGIVNCNKEMEQLNYTDGATSVMVAVSKTHYFIANKRQSDKLYGVTLW